VTIVTILSLSSRPITPIAAGRFLAGNAPQLAFGDKPTLATYVRQDATLRHFFVEAAQQLLWRFVVA
jgi:hypothetical protein